MQGNSRRLIIGLFFVSGACGLVYQVAWTRMMTLVFGISVYAVTTVLCSFMAGLALGSFFFGRLADRTNKLLTTYGYLEIAIGFFAALFPFIMNALEPLFVHIYRNYYVNYYVFSFVRFVIVFGVLLVPTFMMGGTFPILSRYFVRGEKSLGRDIGFLYAINTTGAFVGTFLVGFVMLGYLGVQRSISLAAAANLGLGIVSLYLGRKEGAALPAKPEEAGPAETTPPTSAPAIPLSPRTLWIVLGAIGLSGFASLGLEVLWSRVLVLYVYNSTYAFSSMLMIFLLGLAVGSWIYGIVAPYIRRPLLVFSLLELGIAVWTVFSLFLLGRLEGLSVFLAEALKFDDWLEVVVLILAQASAIMLAPTILMGMTLPLATRLAVPSLQGMGRRIGDVYAVNTLGTVFGSFVVGFVLIPLVGVRHSFMIIALLNALIAAALLSSETGVPVALRRSGAVGCLAFVLLAHFGMPREIIKDQFKDAYGDDLLFYKEEVTDTIMVSEVREAGWEWRTLIFADGRGTAGHWTRMEDRFYGHLPMLLHDNPEDVLVICFGAGNTMGAIGRHSAAKRIDCVELSSGVVEAAKYFETNYNIIEDDRVQLHIEDGRNFLLGTDRQFDIIHLDPPELHTAGVVFLYTEEFYELCKKRLKPGGILSHWFNATKLGDEELRSVVATFKKVFPHGTVWQGPGMYSWNLIASDRPLRPEWAELEKRISEPLVAESLEEFELDVPTRFFSLLLMDERSLGRYAKGAAILTDDRTRIDFTNPRSVHSGYGFVNFLANAAAYEAHLPTDPSRSAVEAFKSGGYETSIRLTEKTDYVGKIIDWTGVPADRRKQIERELRANVDNRIKTFRNYRPAVMKKGKD